METKKQIKNAGVPTVSRVCGDTIVELVYDADVRETGLVVSRFGGLWNIEQEVRIETGELLVPYSPRNNLITTGCVLLPSKPEHHGDKAELLSAVEAFIHRYVDVSPIAEKIAAYYVLLSWVHDAFSELPYFRLRGEYGSGKTRGLLAIGSICYRPFFASGASTVSPIFHTLDNFGGTLILDEADFRFSDATNELIKVFNNGNMRGLPVLRTMPNKDREFNPRAFRVFGPKLIAMRGLFDDEALESRFLTEEMGTGPLRADISITLPATLHTEALALRNRLLHYRLSSLDSITVDPLAVSVHLEPRLRQMALPLLSLVDDASVRKEIERSLVEMYARNVQSRRETAESRVLSALNDAIAGTVASSVSLGDIAARFNSEFDGVYGQPASNKWIGHVLRSKLGIAPHRNRGIYVVPRSEKPKIDALVARYGLAEPVSEIPTAKSDDTKLS